MSWKGFNTFIQWLPISGMAEWASLVRIVKLLDFYSYATEGVVIATSQGHSKIITVCWRMSENYRIFMGIMSPSVLIKAGADEHLTTAESRDQGMECECTIQTELNIHQVSDFLDSIKQTGAKPLLSLGLLSCLKKNLGPCPRYLSTLGQGHLKDTSGFRSIHCSLIPDQPPCAYHWKTPPQHDTVTTMLHWQYMAGGWFILNMNWAK